MIRWRTLLPYIGLYAGYVALLHLADGPWREWTKGTVVDTWTWTHLGWGALAAWMGLTVEELMILAALNEVAEAVIRSRRPDLLWGTPETAANVGIDLVATYVGWRVASGLRNRP